LGELAKREFERELADDVDAHDAYGTHEDASGAGEVLGGDGNVALSGEQVRGGEGGGIGVKDGEEEVDVRIKDEEGVKQEDAPTSTTAPNDLPITTTTNTTTTTIPAPASTLPSPAGPYLPTLRLLAKITPYLSHRSMDVRIAGVRAMESVLEGVGRWEDVVRLTMKDVEVEDGKPKLEMDMDMVIGDGTESGLGSWVDVEALMKEQAQQKKKKSGLAGSLNTVTGTKRPRSTATPSRLPLNTASTSTSTPAAGRKRPKIDIGMEDRHAVLDGLSIPRDLVDEDMGEEEDLEDDMDFEVVEPTPVQTPRKRAKLDSSATVGSSREGTPVGTTKKLGRPPKVKKENSGFVSTSTPAPVPASVSVSAASTSTSAGPSSEMAVPSGPEPTEDQILAGLSSRQAILLKRKIRGGMSKGEAMMESMRLQGGGTPVEETPAPVSVTAPAPPSAGVDEKEKPAKAGRKSGGGKGKEKEKVKEEVKIEDGVASKQATPVPAAAAVVAAPIPGGAVEASRTNNNELDEILPRTADEWVWTRLVDKLEVMLESESWEARHGSALALRDLIRIQGAGCGTGRKASKTDNRRSHHTALERLARKLVLVLVRDRFGDFVGDTVMAPVRESAAQALASVISRMPVTMMSRAGRTLLGMVTQGWKDVPYVWELRHAGLLGLRYMLAVVQGQGVLGDETRGLGMHDVLAATMIG
jgi:hypothetical protein